VATRERKPPGYCCPKWQEQPAGRRAAFPWLLMHQWAHSPTSFSVEGFAERAGIELDDAEEIVKEAAVVLHWLVPVAAPGVQVYAGILTKRR
jgi:hypothetical protein